MANNVTDKWHKTPEKKEQNGQCVGVCPGAVGSSVRSHKIKGCTGM